MTVKAIEQKVEKAFTGVVLLIIVVRFFVAWGSFGDNNVNPFIFLVCDLVTAWPYAHYTTKTAYALTRYEYRKACVSGLWWFFWFIIPYLYIVYVGQDVPAGLWWGLGAWVSLMLVFGVVGMFRKASRDRQELSAH